MLFEQHSAKFGRYELIAQKRAGSVPKVLTAELMDLLGLSTEEDYTEYKSGPTKKNRTLGRRLLQTGKHLRTIVLEPKRLVWAVFDKEALETFVKKLNELNSFIIALLDGRSDQQVAGCNDHKLRRNTANPKRFRQPHELSKGFGSYPWTPN